MNKKKLETLILVVGVIVVGAALALILMGGENPKSPLYTNITFAVGFLFYIIYNMMSTAGLQKEIKELQNHISALKEESARQKKEIEEKTSELKTAQGEIQRLKQQEQKMIAENKELNKALEKFRSDEGSEAKD